MKNVFVFNRLFPSPGGRNTFIENLVSGLKGDFNFEVVSSKKNQSKESGVYSLSLIKYFLSSFFKLTFSSNKPAVILGVGLSSLGAITYGKITNVPTIFNISDTNKRSILSKPERSFKTSLGSKLTIFFESLCLKMCNFVTVPSETSKRELIKDYSWLKKEKIILINEGQIRQKRLTKIRRKYGYSNKDKIILFPYPSKRKNINFLIDIIPELIDELKVKIIILGEKDQLTIKQQQVINKFMKNIFFSGRLSQDKKNEIFSIVDIMIYVPKSESHSYTVLEAINYQVPLILSDVGWLHDEFSEFTIKNLNASNIKLSVKETLNSKTKRFKKFDKINNKYDYNLMLKNYRELFLKCLGN